MRSVFSRVSRESHNYGVRHSGGRRRIIGTGASACRSAIPPRLNRNARVRVIAASSALLQRGLELYATRPDKDWSLTDCISFVVMRDEGISDAATGDHHFAQAGFNALFISD